MKVQSWLVRAARTSPTKEAIFGLSYSQLLSKVDSTAKQLLATGIGQGEQIEILATPSEQVVVAIHALMRIGAVAVPMNPAAPAVTGSNRPLLSQGGEGRSTVVLLLNGEPLAEPTAQSNFGLLDEHDLDAPALIVHTSGSSGVAKPIVLTYGNWLWSAIGSAVALGSCANERWLSALPLFHVGGLSVLMRATIAATTVVMLESWNTETVLAQLAGVGCQPATAVSLVPTTLSRLLDAGLKEPPALRLALLGGAPIPQRLIEDADAAGVKVISTYGLTEACSQVISAGAPLFFNRLRVVEGELLVKGPTVSSGASDGEGWLHTGDLARFTEDGRAELIGRQTELIISGGENVMPVPVEQALERVPGVLEAAVFGREDREWGEVVTAQLVIASGSELAQKASSPAQLTEEIRRQLRSVLAPAQLPRHVEVVAQLPRTASGKLARAELR